MILNFRQIEVFRAVMTARTISGAADLLNVSQPGVSRTLKHIESKIGLNLFERRPNGMIPTPEAERLFKELQPIYSRLDDLSSNMKRILTSEDLTLQIGCAPSLSQVVLPKLLARAKERPQKFIARVNTLSNEDIPDYIVRRNCDFALSAYDPKHPLIIAEKSFGGSIQCVLPCDHVLAKKKILSFEDVVNFELVTYFSDTELGRVINARFVEIGTDPKVSVKVRFNDNACAMVAQGLGIGFVFNYCVTEGLPANLTVRPFSDKLRPVSVYVLRHRDGVFSDKMRKFYENLLADMKTFGEELNRSEAAWTGNRD